MDCAAKLGNIVVRKMPSVDDVELIDKARKSAAEIQ